MKHKLLFNTYEIVNILIDKHSLHRSKDNNTFLFSGFFKNHNYIAKNINWQGLPKNCKTEMNMVYKKFI